MSDKKTVLFWVDLETTGLDEKNGRVLEYAVVLTDLELNELASIEGIVKQDVDEATALMDDYCRNMHTDNGLLAELAKAGSGKGYLEQVNKWAC